MATYDFITIKNTITRILGRDINEARLQVELDRPSFTPEVGRMIVIADRVKDLPRSTRYGTFIEMTGEGEYRITSGVGRYARALTAAEIAQCF